MRYSKEFRKKLLKDYPAWADAKYDTWIRKYDLTIHSYTEMKGFRKVNF